MDPVEELLAARGAGGIDHPGGTLLAHLGRVRDTLRAWGADDVVVRAGHAHALYGTDGFATALADLAERPVLHGILGVEVEALVYAYGSLDRRTSYRSLDTALTDRFTGAVVVPTPALTRALVEITYANELDVLAHSAEVRDRHGAALRELFARWAPWASPAARRAAGT